MVIRLDELREESGKVIKRSYKILELPETKVEEPIKIEYSMKYQDESLWIEGSYTGKIKIECVKCLEEITLEIDGTFESEYLSEKAYWEREKTLKKESNIGDHLYELAVNNEVNLDKLVEEYIILDLGISPSCEPSCKDEELLEKYKGEDVDLRWQGLLNLKN